MIGNYFDKLGAFNGKRAKIITDDGQVFKGICVDYTSRLDNPDGVATICIGDIEFNENEIANIELISGKLTQVAAAL